MGDSVVAGKGAESWSGLGLLVCHSRAVIQIATSNPEIDPNNFRLNRRRRFLISARFALGFVCPGLRLADLGVVGMIDRLAVEAKAGGSAFMTGGGNGAQHQLVSPIGQVDAEAERSILAQG